MSLAEKVAKAQAEGCLNYVFLKDLNLPELSQLQRVKDKLDRIISEKTNLMLNSDSLKQKANIKKSIGVYTGQLRAVKILVDALEIHKKGKAEEEIKIEKEQLRLKALKVEQDRMKLEEEIRKQKREVKGLSVDKILEIKKDYERGESLDTICKKNHISFYLIKTLIEKYKWQTIDDVMSMCSMGLDLDLDLDSKDLKINAMAQDIKFNNFILMTMGLIWRKVYSDVQEMMLDPENAGGINASKYGARTLADLINPLQTIQKRREELIEKLGAGDKKDTFLDRVIGTVKEVKAIGEQINSKELKELKVPDLGGFHREEWEDIEYSEAGMKMVRDEEEKKMDQLLRDSIESDKKGKVGEGGVV
jgi:hypothetical protein